MIPWEKLFDAWNALIKFFKKKPNDEEIKNAVDSKKTDSVDDAFKRL